MNFKQLEAFLWVAELQSFTKAARQLYMSQPAVSFQIKALEENLQAALFQRGDKKVILTEAGRLLYTEAKQMLMHYYKIKAGLDDLKGLKTGHLVLGASTIPGEYLLPRLIGGFNEKYPGIKIVLKIAGTGQVGRWIRDREIDLGIIGAPLEGEGINCIPWIQDHMVLIVPPLHAWANKNSVSVSDFENVALVLREPGSGTRQTLEKKLGEKNISLNKMNRIMELGSTRAVITAVESGLGVSIVSRFAVRESLELGRVCEVRINDFNLSRYLYQVNQPHGIGGYANEAFIDFINDIETCKRCLLL